MKVSDVLKEYKFVIAAVGILILIMIVTYEAKRSTLKTHQILIQTDSTLQIQDSVMQKKDSIIYVYSRLTKELLFRVKEDSIMITIYEGDTKDKSFTINKQKKIIEKTRTDCEKRVDSLRNYIRSLQRVVPR